MTPSFRICTSICLTFPHCEQPVKWLANVALMRYDTSNGIELGAFVSVPVRVAVL